MKLCTDGEKLFALIRGEILDSIGDNNLRWSTIDSVFESSGQSSEFSGYVRGAVTVHLMRRLLRYWAAEKKNLVDESLYVGKVRKHIKNEVFTGLSSDLTMKLARAVISAESASGKDISKNVRKSVLAESRLHHCYLCHDELNAIAIEGDPKHLTLEHIWPSSIGGNSIEGNLIPACVNCQEDTKDTMSWEWLNVHNLVLPPYPEPSALKSITRKQRVAVHFQYAFKVCRNKNISLKQAFREIGPMKEILTHTNTGSPITFFDLHTAQEVL